MLNYDNVTLVPRVKSEISSRRECDTSVQLSDTIELDVPIVASPMPDVCGGDMAFTLRRSGAMGIIHRFQTIQEQVLEYQRSLDVPETASAIDVENYYDSMPPVGCAIGVSDDYKQRFFALYNAGCRIFCVDTANGFNSRIESAISILDSGPESVFIIAGNVATREGYEYLASLRVNAVRVGMAGGSVCTTRQETGVYMPTLESVKECVSARTFGTSIKWPLIIADGGIRHGGDMAKALALGADLVMGGRIFAGYQETPGPVIHDRINNKFYKLYRGAASHGVQKEANGEKPDYNEGAEELVPYIDKSASTVIKKFKGGFQSAMSMMNAKTISEFRKNVRVENL